MDASNIASGAVIAVAARALSAQSALGIISVQSLLAPLLSVQATANPGDSVSLTISTSDTDGSATIGVQVFDNGALLGSSAGASGSWSYTINGITAGTHSLVARRQTANGTIDSVAHSVVVSAGNQPGNVQTNPSTGGNVQANPGTGGNISVGT